MTRPDKRAARFGDRWWSNTPTGFDIHHADGTTTAYHPGAAFIAPITLRSGDRVVGRYPA